MFDDDDEGVFSRLGDMIADKVGFIAPLWIVRRPESLTILDYRPTFMMLLTVGGLVGLVGLIVYLLFSFGTDASFGLWAAGLFAVICFVLSFRCTIREVYHFDKTTESYAFVRQFIHRREVIEGSISQFTDAYVRTVTEDESTSYYVVLKQEGMFLTGVAEQTLREDVPVFNSFDREARIANTIAEFLPRKTAKLLTSLENPNRAPELKI